MASSQEIGDEVWMGGVVTCPDLGALESAGTGFNWGSESRGNDGNVLPRPSIPDMPLDVKRQRLGVGKLGLRPHSKLASTPLQ